MSASGDQTRPNSDGDVVAYDGNSGGNPDVVVHHLPSGASARVGGASTEFLNDLDGNRMAYTSFNSNFDIWVYEFAIDNSEVAVSIRAVNFGDVELGATENAILTITSVGHGAVAVNDVELLGGAPFAIDGISVDGNPILGFPIVLASNEMADVALSFTPGAAMPFADTLRISTDDPSNATVNVALAGTGVVIDPTSEQIAGILEFFDASVEAGTLPGAGNGKSANGRRGALRNMIEAAGDLIDQDLVGNACAQLQDALNRTDGASPPGDFVTGPAASELAILIEELMDTLGCP